MNTNQVEQEGKFKISLQQFQNQNGIKKITKQDGDYNDFTLYRMICRKGGCQAVTNRRQWKVIGDELEVSNVSRLKAYYIKFLFPYEQKYYFGRQEDEELPNIIGGVPRKMVKTQKLKVDQNSTLQVELTRHFEQEEKNKKQFYLRKKKLTHSKAQTKKIILGLQSFMDKTQIIYSLNMILLYSYNIHQPFLFENHQKTFSAISAYLDSIYPPKNQEQLQHLRTLTLIMRNLTFFPKNLKYILGTKMFNLLVTIFNTGLDAECSKNIVDIMNGLVKVGWDCQQVIKQLHQSLLDDRLEEVQTAIEMMRGLVEEREDTLITAVTEQLQVFVRLLLHQELPLEFKQQIIEILSFVADAGPQSKLILIKNNQLIGILIGILQHMRNHQKITQFAALTLNSLSMVAGARAYLKKYQTELLTIGFTDDSLAGIMANILADISNA